MRGSQLPSSATRWQCVPDVFYNSYLLKNHKIAKNSVTSKARGKISSYLESLEFYIFFDARLAKFESNQILLNKISHRFHDTRRNGQPPKSQLTKKSTCQKVNLSIK
jgi:hypothetical protein